MLKVSSIAIAIATAALATANAQLLRVTVATTALLNSLSVHIQVPNGYTLTNAVNAVSHPSGSWFASSWYLIASIPQPAENATAATEIAVEAIAHGIVAPNVQGPILYSITAKDAAAAEIHANVVVAIFRLSIKVTIYNLTQNFLN